MTPRRVVLSQRAILDMENFYSCVRYRSGEQRADELAQRLLDSIHSLDTLSDRGAARDDVGKGLRILPLGWATVAYVVEGDAVIVHAVAGRGRDLSTLFSEGEGEPF